MAFKIILLILLIGCYFIFFGHRVSFHIRGMKNDDK